MKKLLLIVGVVASTFAFGQSNDVGVIQVGLGWGAVFGGADITTNVAKGSSTGTDTSMVDNGVGVNANYALRAQYGVAEKFSVGIYVRKEGAAYVATSTTAGFSWSTTMTVSGFGFGVEPKFYVVNNDKFNFNIAPSIGYSTGSAILSNGFFTENGKAAGLGYGVNLGINWFFSDYVGIYLDLGYAGSKLNGTYDDAALKDIDFDISNSGFATGFGISAKFGG